MLRNFFLHRIPLASNVQIFVYSTVVSHEDKTKEEVDCNAEMVNSTVLVAFTC